MKKGLSFKGYSENLPALGSQIVFDPLNCHGQSCIMAGSMSPGSVLAMPLNSTALETSSNLRCADFPADYSKLPTVAFVIPNLNHDMHNGEPAQPPREPAPARKVTSQRLLPRASPSQPAPRGPQTSGFLLSNRPSLRSTQGSFMIIACAFACMF
jgi:hypothetical protein